MIHATEGSLEALYDWRETLTATGFMVSSNVPSFVLWSLSLTSTWYVLSSVTRYTLTARIANCIQPDDISFFYFIRGSWRLTQLRGPYPNAMNGWFFLHLSKNLSGTKSPASGPQNLGEVCKCKNESKTNIPGFRTTGFLLEVSVVSRMMNLRVAWTVECNLLVSITTASR